MPKLENMKAASVHGYVHVCTHTHTGKEEEKEK